MSDELKELIIEKVSAIPAIWEKNHEHHHNRYVLEKHWRKLSNEVRLSEEDAKRIWRNLRQEFGKQVKRVVKTGHGTPESANPQWPFYRHLLFLKEQFIPRSTSGEYLEQDESDTFSDYFNYEDENNLGQSPSSHSVTEVSNSGQWNDQGNYMERKRKRSSPPAENSLIQLEREKLDIQRQFMNSVDGSDEDIGFFNSLIPHVRLLQPQQKMMFRMQVQQQLYEMLYGNNEPMSILSTNHTT